MPSRSNAVWWYVQRITGALLVILLVMHFWVEHFMNKTMLRGDLTYENILSRISNPVWQAIDISFLIVALIHGLNGLRNIILDFSKVGPRMTQLINVVLVAVGGIWAWWGIDAFSRL